MEKVSTKETPPGKIYLNRDELAHRLGVSRRTVDQWKSQGVLPFTKIGRVIRFPLAEVETSLARFTVNGRNAR